jgi:hypothetical protein
LETQFKTGEEEDEQDEEEDPISLQQLRFPPPDFSRYNPGNALVVVH